MDWTSDMDKFLIENYERMSYSKMGECLGIDKRYRSRVNRRCEYLGLRRHNGDEFNHKIFKEWKPPMAYLLGYMATDGSINYDAKHNDICIRVAERDREHLEVISSMFDSKKLLRYVKGTKSYVLGLSSKECCEDLMSLGLSNNKSNKGYFIDVPMEYLRYFVQGFTDGDGCVGISRGKYLYWTIMGSIHTEEMLDSIKRKVEDTVEISLNKSYYRNLVCISCSGRKAEKLLSWLYMTSEYVLSRKYIKYKEIIKND